jgi:hypothetical protein
MAQEEPKESADKIVDGEVLRGSVGKIAKQPPAPRRWKTYPANSLTGAVLGLVLTGILSISFTQCFNKVRPEWECQRAQWCWRPMPWDNAESSVSRALNAAFRPGRRDSHSGDR